MMMKKKSETYQIASDIQWEDAGEGIVRQIMAYDDNLMMVNYTISLQSVVLTDSLAPGIWEGHGLMMFQVVEHHH